MKILVVYNPKAGPFNTRRITRLCVRKLKKQGHQVFEYELNGFSGEIFDKFGKENIDLVVAVGGDGTVKTCATLILDHLKNASLKIVPAGSTNVLAGSLGVRLPASLRRIGKLDKNESILIDAGRLDSREYFFAGIFLGYLAEVVNKVDQKHKNKLGFGGYLRSFFKNRNPKVYQFGARVDGKTSSFKASSVMIINALSVLGISPVKNHDFTDGVFEVMYMEYNNFIRFVLSVWHFFISTKKVIRFQASSVELECPDGIHVQVDGEEYECGNGNLKVEVALKALRVVK